MGLRMWDSVFFWVKTGCYCYFGHDITILFHFVSIFKDQRIGDENSTPVDKYLLTKITKK